MEVFICYLHLNNQLSRLASLKKGLPKTRMTLSYSNLIEYKYANYDIKKASEDYFALSDELSKAQIALDKINNTIEFEIEDI